MAVRFLRFNMMLLPGRTVRGERRRAGRANSTSLRHRLHTSKTEMRHARVRRTAESGAGAVVEAVTDATQERSPPLYPFRRPQPGGEAHRGAGRVDEEVLTLRQGVSLGQVPVGAPLPDVARHVIQTVAVGRECLDR